MYDSPISVLKYPDNLFESFAKAVNSKIGEQCINIAYKYGIDIDEKTLIDALKADRRRYEKAYDRGYSAGRCDALRELESFKNTGMWEVPNDDEL